MCFTAQLLSVEIVIPSHQHNPGCVVMVGCLVSTCQNLKETPLLVILGGHPAQTALCCLTNASVPQLAWLHCQIKGTSNTHTSSVQGSTSNMLRYVL